MNTRKLFERYWDNKQSIVLYESLIDQRKIDLMPAMTPQLSFETKAHSNESNVEKTVIKWEEDPKIYGFEKAKQYAENDVRTVEKLMGVLSPKMKEIIERRYMFQETIEEIAEAMFLSESCIEKKLKQTFERLDNIAELI